MTRDTGEHSLRVRMGPRVLAASSGLAVQSIVVTILIFKKGPPAGPLPPPRPRGRGQMFVSILPPFPMLGGVHDPEDFL